MSAKHGPATSVNWNGVAFTGYANEGARFGEATGDSAEDAADKALKVLAKNPERQAPAVDAGGATEEAPKEKAAR